MVMVPGVTPVSGQPGQGYAQTGAQPPSAQGVQQPSRAPTNTPAATTGSTTQGPPSLFQQANAGGASGSPSTAAVPPAMTSGTVPGVSAGAAAKPVAGTAAPGVQLQGFGANPGQNLVGTQINPTQSGTTKDLTGLETNAANQLGNQPNLVAANQQAYKAWLNEQDPAYQMALRQATDQAAATGSLGSGQLETSLGNLADTFAQQAMAAETQGNLNALQQQFANTEGAAGELGNLQNTSFGQDVANTNQLNEQQGYQAGQQEQAVQNAAQQAELQGNLQQQQLQDYLNEAGAGFSQTPIGTQAGIGTAFGQIGQQNAQNVGSLLNNYATQQALNQLGTGLGNAVLPPSIGMNQPSINNLTTSLMTPNLTDYGNIPDLTQYASLGSDYGAGGGL